VAAAASFGLFEGVERWSLNTQFHLRGPVSPIAPIVIVSIDEDSFDELDLQWPWPRALHGEFLDTVSRGKPIAVGLDLVFAEPSARGPEDDRALGEAVGRAGNVVLGAAITEVKTPLFTKEDLNAPIGVIRERAAAVGFVNVVPDDDAFVRSGPLAKAFQGDTLPGFDLHLHRLGVEAGISSHPLPKGPNVLINYRGGPKTFPTIPYYQVLSGEVGPEAFAGKLVLVGATSPILHDLFPTPFATHGEMPGVEIHANVLETLFQGLSLTRMPRSIRTALTFLAAVLAVWLTNRLRPLPALGAIGAVAAGYALAAFAAFAWLQLWVDVAGASGALFLSNGATIVENFIREQREKRRLSRYFSPAVVTEIIRHREDVNLGSSRKLMTILFSDIRGFTSMSEKMSPEDVVTFLREYLTVMTDAVFTHGGTVDKYIGDAIMALYNVPFDQPDHAAQAVRTALAFQERLRPLAAKFREKYGVDLKCGVGINTGDAVVGTIGAEQRLEYTAIGDTINLGSRLESITKDFKVSIVISESTHQYVQGQFLTRFLGEVTVKGKEIPVKIYTVAEASSRKDPRSQVTASITLFDGDVAIHAPVIDLSRGGLSARDLPGEYAVGRVMPLRLDLQEAGGMIRVSARVAWTGDDKAGFEFLDLTPTDEAAIQSSLSKQGMLREAAGEPDPEHRPRAAQP
jgi:adenylate cyclase